MPDPVPEPAWPVKAMETTLGSTAAETASTPEALTPLGTSGADAAAGVAVDGVARRDRGAHGAADASGHERRGDDRRRRTAAAARLRCGGRGRRRAPRASRLADSKGGTNVVSEEGVRVSMAPF